ncbi:MAG: TIGR01244 family sulfur transferase [Alphaproteobacteria bacterium]
MTIAKLADNLFVSPQIAAAELDALKAQGIRAIINNRPDGEQADQPASADLEAEAKARGLAYRHIPVVSGKITDDQVAAFDAALKEMPQPVLAFCRSGTRSTSLWALAHADEIDTELLLKRCADAGYDLAGLQPRLADRRQAASAAAAPAKRAIAGYDVVVVGGGAAGIAVASSILRLRRGTTVAIVEPSEVHHYQAAFTLVGGGVFNDADTHVPQAKCIPPGAHWIRAAVAGFEPDHNRVILEDGERVAYRTLVVCPGLKLDWEAVAGLNETLGKNNVTSNYKPGLAPYTWSLIQGMRGGQALFTQPPMPIKCAGAPQKIMYLASDWWRSQGVLNDIHIQFNNAGGVLFGVKEFVPPLMRYVERYGIDLAFNSNLKAIDGPAKKAWFAVKGEGDKVETVEKSFDMIHVCPPQCAPDFIRNSPLAAESGWFEVDQETLRHPRYETVFGLGDATTTPNAKTAAAVRKQAPVAVRNVIAALDGKPEEAVYDGYGSCPLTVERGKVVLAEFGYGGKLMPTFPFDQTKPRWSMWVLKRHILPHMYFDVLFKGREWMAKPKVVRSAPKRVAIAAPTEAESRPARAAKRAAG